MSIQDKSFPHDTLLDDLHFLTNNSKNFVFPNREKRECSNPPAMSTNTSDSDQNISSETSTNGGRPLSELSVKTSASDPLGLMQEDDGKTLGLATQNSSKAASYQDIHSEYTKRRYKHVESKVGQYIASIRADEQRRRSAVRFQRHRSMPDTLSGVSLGAGAQTIPLTATLVNEKSAYEQLVHEKERIQSYNDYLQTRLDEKMGETMRLKRNVDFLRIELSNCKDKLKKQHPFATSTSASSNGLNCFNSGPTLTTSLGRHSLQSLVYCQAKSTKSTQTDLLTPPPPQLPPPLLRARDFYTTSDTPDANNNTFGDSSDKAVIPCATSSINCLPIANIKSLGTIQPLSLNFSNNVEDTTCSSSKNSSNNDNTLQRTNDISIFGIVPPALPTADRARSHISLPSSGDDAIDIEAIELDARRPKQRNRFGRVLQSSQQVRQHLKSCDSEDTIYYEQVPSQSYSSVNTAGFNYLPGQDENYISNKHGQNKANPSTVRRRWLRLFGPCVRGGGDPNLNQTLNNNNESQFPLLEKSYENICRNLR